MGKLHQVKREPGEKNINKQSRVVKKKMRIEIKSQKEPDQMREKEHEKE